MQSLKIRLKMRLLGHPDRFEFEDVERAVRWTWLERTVRFYDTAGGIVREVNAYNMLEIKVVEGEVKDD